MSAPVSSNVEEIVWLLTNYKLSLCRIRNCCSYKMPTPYSSTRTTAMEIPKECVDIMYSLGTSPIKLELYCDTFYGTVNSYSTRKEVRDIVDLGQPAGTPILDSAWEEGEAHKYGIDGLLLCPNIVPQFDTPEASNFRMVLVIFDNLPCFHDTTKTWKDMKQLLIRYYHYVFDAQCHATILNHKFIGGKRARLRGKYMHCKNLLASSLLYQFAYGNKSTRSSKVRICEMGRVPENKMVNLCFVKPMTEFLLKEMNPFSELDQETIQTMDVGRSQEDWISLAKTRGIFSQASVLEKARLPTNHVEAYTAEDCDICKGVPYVFARLGALVVDGFDFPSDDDISTWTEQERRDLFKPFDLQYCVPIHPPVKGRLAEYGIYRGFYFEIPDLIVTSE
jgi:hypothetical protein